MTWCTKNESGLDIELSFDLNAEALPPGEWELLWHDEFEGNEIDPKRWDYWLPEQERRKAVNKTHNTYVDGKGHLVIRTQKESQAYTASGLWTRETFRYKFGYWEFRCSFEQINNIGHWPACWIQTPTIGKVIGDPNVSGLEIDVMELPWRDGYMQHAIHWDGYAKQHHKLQEKKLKANGLMKGFHRFGLLWTDKKLIFYVDGKQTWCTNVTSCVDQFIILSEEIDDWGGVIEKNDKNLPDYFLVDYVRVYGPKDRH